ncbi:hypothetical protein M9458_007216 [Cirrhinus mrigala]|uniref:Murine leukemia virus integrase C-terminal domain-containing protein n=1 Tax=Cirrhinus mrigala TaxID=683832 RepID=A0ABD0RL67_CIRMR
MSYRMQTNRNRHLTPHEMLTGRPMPVPYCRAPYKGPPLEQLQMELRSYMMKLTAIYLQEKRKEPREETETACPVVPGDQVYLRVFRRKWNEPRREGPYKVVRATPTAAQVEGSTTWYHLNHCTRVPKESTEKERNSRENDEEEPETHDEVQTDESSNKDPQGAHILLSDQQERKENKSDNLSEDHYMSSAPNNASPDSPSRGQPDFPSIDLSTLEQQR